MIAPDLTDEENAAFEEYEELLETAPVDCDADMVEEVASKLRGGAGPSGVDTIALKNWFLRHSRASRVLREEMAEWTEWLCNELPPWVAYRAMMGARLVALDKEPGTRPLGFGECLQRGFAKCVLKG